MIANFNRLGMAFNEFKAVNLASLSGSELTAAYSRLGVSVQGLTTKELQLIATSAKLNEEQMMQILTQAGLSKEQAKAQIMAIGLANSEQTLSAVTVQNVLATSSLDVAQQQRMLTTLGLVNSEGALIGTTEGLTASSFMAAAASTGLSEAEARQLAIQLGLIPNTATLSATIKGLTASIWSSVKAMWAFLTTNPVGWAILAAASIFVVVKAFDAITTTVGEASDALEESQKSLEETTSKLESLQSELKTANERIAELQKLADDGTITLIEQNELEKLKKANDELQRQIDLAAIENKDAQNKANKDAMRLSSELSDDANESDYTKFGKKEWYDYLDFRGGNQSLSAEQFVNSAVSQMGKLSEDSAEYKRLMESLTPIMNDYQNIVDNLVPTTDEESAALKNANIQLDKIRYALGDSAAKTNVVKAAIEKYGNRTKELESYLLSVGLTQEQVTSAIKAYGNEAEISADKTKAFADAVWDSAEETQKLKSSLESLSNTSELLQTLKDEMKELGGISTDTLEKILGDYPAAGEVVAKYLAGLASAKDVYAKLQEVYDDDKAKFKESLIDKLKYDNEFYSKLGIGVVKYYDAQGKLYEFDLENCKNLAQAKYSVETQLLSKLGNMWYKYYDATTGAFTEYYNSVMTNVPAWDAHNNQLYKEASAVAYALGEARDAYKNIENIAFDGINFGGLDTSLATDKIDNKGGSKDKEDANKLAFEKAKADLDHRRAMNMISEKQYLDELDRLYKKHFSDRSKYLAEYTQYEEEVYSGRQKLLEEAKSAIEDLHDSTMDMIKKEKDAEKEAWEEKKTALQEYVDARKEALEQEKEASDYAESLAEKQKKLNDLNLEMNSLMGDTSAEGQRRRIELAQEIADTQTELDDYVADHEYDAQMDAIDKEADAQISAYDEQIELIDEYLNNQNLLVQDAYDRMNGMSAQLKNDLIAYNKEFGTGMQQDVIDKWNDAYKAAKAYGDLMNMGGTVTTISSQIGKPPTTSGGSSGGSSSGGGSSGGGSGGGSSGGGNKPAVGSTVSVEASATNFGSKSGGVAMADFVSGGQFTVYQVSGGQVLIGRNGTYTGWVNLSDIVGYAKGTDYLPYTGFVKHGENGEEMVLGSAGDKYALLNRGSKIFTAAKTAKLDNFLSSPSDFILNSLNQKFSGRGGVLGSVTNNVSQMTNNIIFDIDGADATVVKDEIVRVIPELTRRICANLNKELIQSGNKLNAKNMG